MRKFKLLKVSPDALLSILNWKRHNMLPVFSGLPEGTSVHAVHYDFATGDFILKLWHGSFESVPEGREIPYINGVCERFEWIEIPCAK